MQLVARLQKVQARISELRKNTHGFLSMGPALAIVGVVVGVIITVLIVASLASDYFNATSDITDAFGNSGLTGTPGVIAGIVAILIPLALLFGLATIVLRAVR